MILRIVITLVFMVGLASGAGAVTEVRSLPTRPGVTLDFLFITPDNGLTSHDALIMFPGGNGTKTFKLMDNGVVHGWNFLVRSSPALSRHGQTIIIVDPPSDHPTGMGTGFRESSEHAEDIGSLVNYLEIIGIDRIFLVGNSRGTISAASVASQLPDTSVKGVILTSSLDYDNFMRWLPLEKILKPVLMIHHREDACRVSDFNEAERTRDFLKITTNVQFVEVNGGTTPMSAPCDNLSNHGFFGVEDRAIQVINDWIDAGKLPGKPY